MIALALVVARVLGHVFDKLQQPPVIGEILAGILLGGATLVSGMTFFLGEWSWTVPSFSFQSPEFTIFAQIGILFLLFLSGLETHLSTLRKTGKHSLLVASGGVIVPFFFGFVAGLFLHYPLVESIVIGLILTATSVGVTVRTLLDLHVLDSEVGATVLGGAVIDDIIGILLFTVVLGTDPSVLVVVKIAVFFFVFLFLGLKIIDRVLDVGERIHLPKAFLSISLAIFLLYAFFAEIAGIAGIIGAFVAGILIGNTLKSRKIIDDVQALAYGFFVPLFFVWVGAKLWEGAPQTVESALQVLILAVVIIVVAILGKLIGCGVGAKLAGMGNRASLQIGIAMMPRMELALIIASQAIASKAIGTEFSHDILAATVILTVFTTLLTPFLLKQVFKKR